MKKALRFILVLLVVLVAVVLILAIVEPKDITVTRSVTIKAPKEVIFDQIVKFKNWTHWSPWYAMDPQMTLTYSGTDGQPGSGYHWVGTDTGKTGEGEMKNTSVTGTSMNFEVNFSKPMKNVALGMLKAEDTAGMTKATWSFSIHFKFPWNAMGAFMNMDKELGKDFEKGLNNMKNFCETNASMSTGIMETQYPGRLFAGIRSTVKWDEMTKFFMDKYPMIGKEAGAKITGPSSALYYKWDTINKQADLVAAFPVSDSSSNIKGVSYFNIAPSKAVMYVMKGGYSGEMKAHTDIMKYIQSKGMAQYLVIEEYPTGPGTEPDSNKWVTNIYYLIK